MRALAAFVCSNRPISSTLQHYRTVGKGQKDWRAESDIYDARKCVGSDHSCSLPDFLSVLLAPSHHHPPSLSLDFFRARSVHAPPWKRVHMDQYQRQLVRGLFTAATEVVEAAHILAVEGQSPRRTADQYARLAQRLNRATKQVQALSEAALVAARCSISTKSKKTAHRP
jgi:hypothetical protein